MSTFTNDGKLETDLIENFASAFEKQVYFQILNQVQNLDIQKSDLY